MTKLIEANSLSRYIEEISKIPILTEEEERKYALLKEQGDLNAAKVLVTSHLKLVVKIASKYRNYGLPMADLISEGNIGLMKAVKDFSLEKGCRIATYAMWWIKANIQEYILKSWSLVKIGTTLNQKKLFFNLSKIKSKILNYDKKFLSESDIKKIAGYLNVEENDVKEMDKRMFIPDISINKTIGNGDSEEKREFGDLLPSKEIRQDILLDAKREKAKKMKLLKESLSILNERERDIIENRRFIEDPKTLKEFAEKYGISSERVRQIEEQGIKKMQNYILNKIR